MKQTTSLPFIVTSEVLYLLRSCFIINSSVSINHFLIGSFFFLLSSFRGEPQSLACVDRYSLYSEDLPAWLTGNLAGTMRVAFHQFICGRMIMLALWAAF